MKKIFLILCCLHFVSFLYASNVFYANGESTKKQIALTFDDGPGACTEEILKILKDKDVKATFFLLGVSIQPKKQLVKDIYEQGHQIANHTYNHFNFYKYKKDDIHEKMQEELLKCEQLINKIIDYKTKIVRFPHGFSRNLAKQIAKENGYIIVTWSFGCDWQTKLSRDEMYEQYKKNIKSGAIFLMHDLGKNKKVVSFLPQLIDDIKKEGYELVTINELLNIK
ncbi:MAG: polysaccharide deacetylase family protein [Endomicrobiaceae bacterium]|nr:polysaccharide deacetylase family protein [Endomicrobiaceae bacterium]